MEGLVFLLQDLLFLLSEFYPETVTCIKFQHISMSYITQAVWDEGTLSTKNGSKEHICSNLYS